MMNPKDKHFFNFESIRELMKSQVCDKVKQEVIKTEVEALQDKFNFGDYSFLKDCIELISYSKSKEFKQESFVAILLGTFIFGDNDDDFYEVLDVLKNENIDDKHLIYSEVLEEVIEREHYHYAKILIDELNQINYFQDENYISEESLDLSIASKDINMIELIGPYLKKPINSDIILFCIESGDENISMKVLEIDDAKPSVGLDYLSYAISQYNIRAVEQLAKYVTKDNSKLINDTLAEYFNLDIFNIIAPRMDINDTKDGFLHLFIETGYYSEDEIQEIVTHAKKDNIDINSDILIASIENEDENIYSIILANLNIDNKKVLSHINYREYNNAEHIKLYDKLKIEDDKNYLEQIKNSKPNKKNKILKF